MLEQRRFGEVYRLWSDGGRASGLTEPQFVAAYDKYAEIHSEVGAPGEAEGAAGSIYVDIPFRLYGKLKDGGAFNLVGTVTLRRVNDVPGSTAEQRQWKIYRATCNRGPEVRFEPVTKENAMSGFEDIREHMEVIGADGVHVGTVDRIDGDRIKLTKADRKAAIRDIIISSRADWSPKSKATRSACPPTPMSRSLSKKRRTGPPMPDCGLAQSFRLRLICR